MESLKLLPILTPGDGSGNSGSSGGSSSSGVPVYNPPFEVPPGYIPPKDFPPYDTGNKNPQVSTISDNTLIYVGLGILLFFLLGEK